jgi:hypothetical protein
MTEHGETACREVVRDHLERWHASLPVGSATLTARPSSSAAHAALQAARLTAVATPITHHPAGRCLACWDSLAAQSALPDDCFEVRGTITEQMTQGVQNQVLSQLPEGVPFENFYPEAVISYASGKRPQDCAGAGPGMYYAADLVKLLNGRGVQCFSGLHVPPGKDWKTFMLRLKGHRARAKVLIVVLTKALYESKPCLDEIHTAVKKGITLLPIYFEEALPSKPNQWTKFIKDDDLELMVLDVQKQLGKINGIPHPGTVFTVPDAMQRILIEVEKHVGAQRELRSAVSVGHGVNDFQV